MFMRNQLPVIFAVHLFLGICLADPTKALAQLELPLIGGEMGQHRLVIHMTPEARRDAEAGADARLPETNKIDESFATELRNWKANQTMPPPGIYGNPPVDAVLSAFETMARLNPISVRSSSDTRQFNRALETVNTFYQENSIAKQRQDAQSNSRYLSLKAAFGSDPAFSFDDAKQAIGFNGSQQLLAAKSRAAATDQIAQAHNLLGTMANEFVARMSPQLNQATSFQRLQEAFGDTNWQRDFPRLLDRAFERSAAFDFGRFDSGNNQDVLTQVETQLLTDFGANQDPKARLAAGLLSVAGSNQSGFLIGEDHGDPLTRIALTDNMRALRLQGVDTIYAENFSAETQNLIDRYLTTPDGISNELDSALQSIEQNDPTRSLRGLLQSAKTFGMRIVGLNDPLCTRDDPRLPGIDPATGLDSQLVSRAARLNFLASEKITTDPKRQGKFIALVGAAHGNTHDGGIPGMSQLLRVPMVENNNEGGESRLELIREDRSKRAVAPLVRTGLNPLQRKMAPKTVRNVMKPDEFVAALRQRMAALTDDVQSQRDFAAELNLLPEARRRLIPFDEVAEKITDVQAARLVIASAQDDPRLSQDAEQNWDGTSDQAKSTAAALNRLSLLDYKQLISQTLQSKLGISSLGPLKGLDRFLSEQMPASPKLLRRFLSELLNQIPNEQNASSSLLRQLSDGEMGLGSQEKLKAAAQAALGGVERSAPMPSLDELKNNDDSVAKAAWLRMMPDLESGKFGVGVDDIDDLIRTQKLIANAPRMMEMLRPLNDSINEMIELNKTAKRRDLTPEEASQVAVKAMGIYLSKKEAEHGLSQSRILPLGVLSPDLFLKLPALGYVAKDPGAGIAHGEFTHRLQWFAIMESFEQDLDEYKKSNDPNKKFPWRRTPYELYTGIGKRDMLNDAEDRELLPKWQRHASAWAALMDQPGGNADEGFRRPDTMEATLSGFLRDSPIAKGNLPALDLLSLAVRTRHNKRQAKATELQDRYLAMTDEQQRTFLKGMGRDLDDPATFRPNNRNFEELAMQEYSVKKTNSGDYEIFDESRPNEKLLIRKGDPRATEQYTELIAWHLRQNRFNLPLLPEQQAKFDAPRIENDRLKALIGQRNRDRPAPQRVANSNGIENQYDKLPVELLRASQKLNLRGSGEYDNNNDVKYDARLRPPLKVVVSQYDEIPDELRNKDRLASLAKYRSNFETDPVINPRDSGVFVQLRLTNPGDDGFGSLDDESFIKRATKLTVRTASSTNGGSESSARSGTRVSRRSTTRPNQRSTTVVANRRPVTGSISANHRTFDPSKRKSTKKMPTKPPLKKPVTPTKRK